MEKKKKQPCIYYVYFGPQAFCPIHCPFSIRLFLIVGGQLVGVNDIAVPFFFVSTDMDVFLPAFLDQFAASIKVSGTHRRPYKDVF